MDGKIRIHSSSCPARQLVRYSFNENGSFRAQAGFRLPQTQLFAKRTHLVFDWNLLLFNSFQQI
jgi:hypothetical protein